MKLACFVFIVLVEETAGNVFFNCNITNIFWVDLNCDPYLHLYFIMKIKSGYMLNVLLISLYWMQHFSFISKNALKWHCFVFTPFSY